MIRQYKEFGLSMFIDILIVAISSGWFGFALHQVGYCTYLILNGSCS